MKWFYDLVVFLCALPGLIWFRPKRIYEGGRKVRVKGGVLTIANHVGYYDPIYLMYGVPYRRHHFVCTKDILSNRFRVWFLQKCMCIPIDRDNMSMESFRRIVGVMKEGGMVTMFPEGHIVKDAKEKEKFKSGMVLMAMQAHAPILPENSPSTNSSQVRPKSFFSILVSIGKAFPLFFCMAIMPKRKVFPFSYTCEPQPNPVSMRVSKTGG